MSEQEAIALAQSRIAPFKKKLGEALRAALAEGPLSAVDVCAQLAPKLAQEASSEGVTVGRSALRLRNPDNAPRAWLKPLLEELAGAPQDQRAPRVLALPSGGYGYAEPIVLQPQCVVCHGTAVSPELAAHIRARYPADQAMGFSPGDLRGVFWAEIAGAARKTP